MAIDNSPKFSTILSSDITFKTLVDEVFAKKSEIAPGVDLFVEKNKEPAIKLVKGLLGLEWCLKCPLSNGCLEMLGDVELKNGNMSCHKTCSKVVIKVDSEHGRVKETITFSENLSVSERQSLSNISYTIEATGLTPEPRNLVSGVDEYLHINWKDSEDNIQICWPVPEIWDDAGGKTYGYYKIVSTTEIQIVINQTWLGNSTGKIHVDPTGAIYSSGPNANFSNGGRDRNLIWNGARAAVFYSDIGSVQRTYIATTPTDPSSNWASSANPISGAYYLNCHTMSDADQVFIGVPITGTTAQSANLTAAGSWSGATNITGFSSNFQHQFDSCVDEDGLTIWVLAQTSSGAFELAKLTNKGATVNGFGTYTDPTIPLQNSLQGAFGIEPLDSNRLMLVSMNSSNHIVAQIYTIDTNAWATPVTIRTTPAFTGQSKWQLHRDSNGDIICLFCTGSSAYWAHYDESTDTWTNGSQGGTSYGGTFCSTITDDDKIIVGDGSGFNDRAKWAATSDMTTWTNITAGVASSKLVHAYKGGPVVANQHNILFNTVIGTAGVCLENVSYQTISGGDVDPPAGVDITYPTAALTGVSICPSIVCSAGTDATPPISYYFQVDTVNTFDSVNLQESGWQSADTSWTPSTQLTTETVYYTRVRARDAVEPPNTGSYATTITFTTGWQWPGLTQPTIVYDGTTVVIPVPVKCRLDSQIADNINVALDKSIEVVNLGYPKEMSVTIEPIWLASFKTAIELWFDSHAGQGKSFTFTSGQNTRYDGVWWLKDTELRPKIIRGGGRSYQFTFKRVYD